MAPFCNLFIRTDNSLESTHLSVRAVLTIIFTVYYMFYILYVLFKTFCISLYDAALWSMYNN